MQFRLLTYRFIQGKSDSVNFMGKTSLLTLSEAENCTMLSSILSLAMFGAEEKDLAEIDPNASVCLEFLFRGKNYSVERSYEEGEKTVVQERQSEASVTLSAVNAKKILGEAFGMRGAFLTAAESEEDSFLLDGQFLRSVLDVGAKSGEEIAALLTKELQTQEEQKDVLKAIAYAEKHAKEIEGGAEGARLEKLAEEKAGIYETLRRAERKAQFSADAEVSRRELAEYTEKNKDVLSYADALQRDDDIAEIRELLKERDAALQTAKKLTLESADQLTRQEELKKKTEGGERTEKDLEAEFIYKIERVKNLEQRYMDAMSAADEKNSEMRQGVEVYFAVNDPKITELQNKKKRLDSEYDALLLSITGLEDKKKGLVRPMSYKKAVIDGTVMEHKIEKLTASIEDSTRRSGEMQLEISAKNEDIADLGKLIAEKTAEKTALLRDILGGTYQTKEDALNADAAKKNMLYANIILIEGQKAEIAALKEKVAKLKIQNSENEEKRKDLNSAKSEIEIHVLKLNYKLKSLEDTYSAKIAENIYAEQTSKLEYGKRCPVCDSYIIKKNDIPKADVGGVLADIKKLKDEIADCEAKIQKILLKLGAYLSTIASGDAYLAALQCTLVKKEAAVQKLLKDSGAESFETLTAVLARAGENSRALNAKVTELALLETELRSAEGKRELLSTSIQQLSGREAKRIRLNVEKAQLELEGILKEYRKLMPVFSGKPAKELLTGSLIDDIELETVEGDLVTQTKHFRDVTIQKIETDRLLILLKNRLIADVNDAENGNAVDILLKTMAKKSKELAEELIKANAELEDVKIRLAAVRRVTQKAGREKGNGEISSFKQTQAVERAGMTAEDAERRAKDLLASLGFKSLADAEQSAVTPEERSKMEQKLAEYSRTTNRLRVQAELAANRPVTLEYIDEGALKERLNSLKSEESLLVKNLILRDFAKEERTLRAAEKAVAEDRLAEAVSRRKAIEMVSCTVQDGKIDTEVLAENVQKLAAEQMFQFTKGKLKLVWEGSAATLKKGEKMIPATEFGRYEKVALKFSLLAAIQAPAAVLNGVAPEAICSFGQDEKKDILELCAEYSKHYSLTVCAEDGKAEKYLTACI